MQKRDGVPFDLSSSFAVQWQPTGSLLVREAPFLRGDNPFVFGGGGKYYNVLPAVDRVTEEFFAAVGKKYKSQAEALENDERGSVEFPVVNFDVRVRGTIDKLGNEVAQGTGVGQGKVTYLDGATTEEVVEVSIAGYSAYLHPYVSASKTAVCFAEWEINGHPDPNCEWQWYRCVCTKSCCTHIVQFGGKCYTEKCAWGWLWMACGCHRDQEVQCPDCV